MRRVEAVVSGILRVLVVLLLVFSGVLACAGVLLRYGFGVSYNMAEELCRYSIVFAVMFYFGPLITRDTHLSMNLLIFTLPERLQRYLDVTIHICLVCLLVWLGIASNQWFAGIYEMKMLTMSGNILAYIPSAAVPVGIWLAAFYALLRVVYRLADVPLTKVEMAE